MRRGERNRFRPSLDGRLEDRAAPSLAAVAPAGVPTLSHRAYTQAMDRIDAAFDAFRGRERASGVLGDLFGGAVDALFSSGDPSSGTPPSPSDRGDLALLKSRLLDAVAPVPYGRTAVAPVLAQRFDPWSVTPADSGYFRDLIKAAVRRQVVTALRTQSLAWARP